MQHSKSSSFTRPTDVGKLKSFQSRWCPTRLTAAEIVLHKQKRPRSPSQYDGILPNSSGHYLGVWRGITWTSPKNKVMVYCTASDMENNIPQNREWSQGASWWLYCIASDNGCDVQRNLWFQRASLVRYHTDARLWLLHRFGRWVLYATKFRSLGAIIQCEDILNVQNVWEIGCDVQRDGVVGRCSLWTCQERLSLFERTLNIWTVCYKSLRRISARDIHSGLKKQDQMRLAIGGICGQKRFELGWDPSVTLGRNTTGNKSSGVDS
jgi:hypothetical protein